MLDMQSNTKQTEKKRKTKQMFVTATSPILKYTLPKHYLIPR